MHHWEPAMIRFMQDASEQSDYFSELAKRIAPHCSPDMYVCDAGCGLGYLSFELAPYVAHIDAIDKVSAVTNTMRHLLAGRSLLNISIQTSHLADLSTDISYDLMLCCLSVSFDEAEALARAHHAKKLIVIHKLKQGSRSTPATRCRSNLYCAGDDPRIAHMVTPGGIECCGEVFTLELGQPLRTLQDTGQFFETYRDDLNPGSSDFSALFSQLEYRDSNDWPYYFPKQRRLCMFVLDLEYEKSPGRRTPTQPLLQIV
jgi:hypothetical protein